MTEVQETPLPGVGVRHEFTTESGVRLGVIVHRGGRRELLVYDRRDPDVCHSVGNLSESDSRTLAELLGASRVTQVQEAIQREIDGLTIDWIRIGAESAFAGRSIADGEIRSRTGASIVAVVRDGVTTAAPEPSFVFAAGDVAVAVGTGDGLAEAHSILSGR